MEKSRTNGIVNGGTSASGSSSRTLTPAYIDGSNPSVPTNFMTITTKDGVKFFHPSLWGVGYFLREDNAVPYQLVGNKLIELRPINPPDGWRQDIQEQL